MDQDGANHQYLTDGKALVLTPRFSPSAQEITYLSYAGGTPRVYLFNIDTGRQEVVGDFPGMTFAPRFSPDGNRLVLSRSENGASNIYSLDLRSKQVTPADQRQRDRHDAVLFAGRQQDRVQFRPRRLAAALRDGRRTAARLERISFGSGKYGTPVWSPRGDLIAFTKIEGGTFYIGVMRPDGSGERLLTQDFLVEGPTWAPNGRVLMYFRQGRGRRPAALRDRPDRHQPARDQDAGRCFRSGLVSLASLGRGDIVRAALRPSEDSSAAQRRPDRSRCGMSGIDRLRSSSCMYAAFALMGALLMLAACSSNPEPAPGGPGGPIGPGGPGGALARFGPGSQQDLAATAGDRVFFAYDRADISPEAQQILQRQAQWLRRYPNVSVTIEGHTDERGTREYNLALGERRAQAVKNVLVALGTPASRISTISYGKERPGGPAFRRSVLRPEPPRRHGGELAADAATGMVGSSPARGPTNIGATDPWQRWPRRPLILPKTQPI